jgi:hypothetical protein
LTYAVSLCLVFLVPALVLWAFAFRFLPFCFRAYRAVKDDERAQADFEERVMLKAMSLRDRHDVLREALVTLVDMHRSGNLAHEALGNWEWALDRAEKALALTATPLLQDSVSAPEKAAVQT